VITVSGTGVGNGSGHGHGQTLNPVFMSIPGISICVPTTPYDAKGLLKTCLRRDDPVIYSVDRVLLSEEMGEVPEDDYTVPLGKARLVRQGNDVTVVAIGKMVRHAEKCAVDMENQGISVEIIDPRSIAPLDSTAILESVAKTGRLIVAEESRIVNGVGTEILAIIASEDPGLLKAPAKRIAAPMIPIPAAPILESMYLPSTEDISDMVRELMVIS
jgi:pyruvate dehydrogenase E1 component beta subunit